MRLVEFVKATDATKRQIDYWCRHGIPLADPDTCKGSGVFREYYTWAIPRVKLLVKISRTIRNCPVEIYRDAFFNYDKGCVALDDDLSLIWRTYDRTNEAPKGSTQQSG